MMAVALVTDQLVFCLVIPLALNPTTANSVTVSQDFRRKSPHGSNMLNETI